MIYMWHEGTISIPTEDGKTVICKYWVKAYDEGSVYGINEGRISKLTIKIGNKVTANYDREWDIRPAATDKVTQIAYSILLNDYN